jgi:hypothetical protein
MFNITFYIAGVQHHQMHGVLNLLRVEDTFVLTAEPTNKYDPNAVRIEDHRAEGVTMCGYVPKKFSSEVSAMLTIGKPLTCKITELFPDRKPWEQCKVTIEEVAE